MKYIYVLLFSLLLCLPLALAIQWEDCEAITDVPSSPTAECAAIPLPGDYLTQTGAVTVYVKRLTGTNSRDRIIWLVSDGPGLSGTQYEETALNLLQATDNRFDIYMMDHRGTGRSVPALNCPSAPLDVDGDCFEFIEENYGLEMSFINSYSIAQDYLEISQMVALENGVPAGYRPLLIGLYGAGYGAYIINQILMLDPDNFADGVVLDSYMYPTILDSDQDANERGLHFVDGCMPIADCRARLQGNDAVDLVEDLFQYYSVLDCPEALGIPSAQLRTILRNFAEDVQLRDFILPVVARMTRCNNDDVNFLRGLTRNPQLSEAVTPVEREIDESYVFRNQIIISDFTEPPFSLPPSSAALRLESDELYFSNYIPSTISELYDVWEFSVPPFFDPYDFAPSNVPMLILGAEYDMITHPQYSEEASQHFNGDLQRYIAVNYALHNVMLNSPTEEGDSCGFELVARFFRTAHTDEQFNPYDVDIRCLFDLQPPDYVAEMNSTQQLALQLFGTTDVWGSGVIPHIPDDGDAVDGSSSSYFFLGFTSDDLPAIPNLTIETIFIIDSFDSSTFVDDDGTLSWLSTAVLPSPAQFGPDGTWLGAGAITAPSWFLLFLLPLFPFFANY